MGGGHSERQHEEEHNEGQHVRREGDQIGKRKVLHGSIFIEQEYKVLFDNKH